MAQASPPLLMRIALDMGPAQQVQSDKDERRLIYQVRGGTFDGARLRGRALPTTGDWVSVIGDKISIDVRLMLETDDGARILVSYEGIEPLSPDSPLVVTGGERPPEGDYYFEVEPVLQTSSAKYGWLNDLKAVGVGARLADGIVYDIYESRRALAEAT